MAELVGARVSNQSLTSPTVQTDDRTLQPVAWLPLLVFAAVAVIFHLAIAGGYGWMRDEMYYVEAGKHLAGGYVDFPVMVALLANVQRFLFGTSLAAIHVFPAFAGAAIIVVTGLMARELGGGRTAQSLAGLSALVAPVFIGADALFTMDAFDELWLALAAYVLVRILAAYDPARRGSDISPARRNLWLVLGLIFGVGLMTKLTILAYALAIVIGFLLSRAREELRTPWPHVAGLVSFLFLIPYVVWNVDNDWATLAFWHTYSHGESTATFLIEVFLLMQPLSVVLWLPGLWRLMTNPTARAYRPLAIAWIFLLILFLAGHGKSYFFIPAFPPLLAAGSISLEALAGRHPRLHLVSLTSISLILGGVVLAPVVAPILPPKTLASVDSSPIQPIADKFGWPQFVQSVATVYGRLPAAERSQATILAGNYGEASALSLFGPRYHLPQVISPDNTFWFWGRRVTPTGTVIAIDVSTWYLDRDFASVRPVAVVPPQDGIQNEEVGRHIYVCSGLKKKWSLVWKQLQDFS